MYTGKGAIKLCTDQTLTAVYADTTVSSVSISEESVATLDIIYTTGAAETNNSLQVQLSFSHDGSTWVTETYASLSGGTSTLAPLEHSIAGAAAGTAYKAQLVVPFCSRHLKVQVKETGVAANYGTVSIILTVAAASGQERNAQSGGGDATAANQVLELAQLTTIAGDTTSLDGKVTACNTGAVVLTAGTSLIGKASVGQDTASIYNGTTALTPKFAVIDCATSGDNTIIAAVADKKIRVLALLLVAAGTVNTRFESGASGTALTGQMNLVANAGYVLPFNPVGWFETGINTLLNLELSAAISVDGCCTYIEV